MDALQAFLAMDGYASFVWPAYGLALGGVVLLVALALGHRRRAALRLQRLEALEAAEAGVDGDA